MQAYRVPRYTAWSGQCGGAYNRARLLCPRSARAHQITAQTSDHPERQALICAASAGPSADFADIFRQARAA